MRPRTRTVARAAECKLEARRALVLSGMAAAMLAIAQGRGHDLSFADHSIDFSPADQQH